MKRKVLTFLAAALFLLALSCSCFADVSATGSVRFDGNTLKSSFSAADLTGAVSQLEPGDFVTFTITLLNDSSISGDWFMRSDIIKSFEDSSPASGGAYSYDLVYIAPDGTSTPLYTNALVGGEGAAGGEGLRDVGESLKNYFYIGTLAARQQGTVRLVIGLDGETQGNNYQNTLADLQMGFAVEPTGQSTSVRTGDETRILPWLIGAAVGGLGLLTVAVIRLRAGRKKR